MDQRNTEIPVNHDGRLFTMPLPIWDGQTISPALMPPDPSGVEILPADAQVTVVYNPNARGIGYAPWLNKIVVGYAAHNYTEAGLLEPLRHEYAHAIFGNLSEAEQQTIVDLFLAHHRDDVSHFYDSLRSAIAYDEHVYDESYFVPDEKFVALFRSIGRGERYVRREYLWHGDQCENPNLTRVVNELIAYAVGHRTRKESISSDNEQDDSLGTIVRQAVPEYTQNKPLLQRNAADIIDQLHPKVHAELDRHGFFNIEGAPLLAQLKEDPQFELKDDPYI